MLDIRSRERERDRHDKKRRRLLHEYNNRTIPFERGATPPPPVPRLLMRNIVNVDYVYQESVFPVLLY